MNGNNYYNNVCKNHSGLVQEVVNVKEQQERQESKIDQIVVSNRSILGGVVVACIMLILNLVAGTL